jgi:hypothetical protein
LQDWHSSGAFSTKSCQAHVPHNLINISNIQLPISYPDPDTIEEERKPLETIAQGAFSFNPID